MDMRYVINQARTALKETNISCEWYIRMKKGRQPKFSLFLATKSRGDIQDYLIYRLQSDLGGKVEVFFVSNKKVANLKCHYKKDSIKYHNAIKKPHWAKL